MSNIINKVIASIPLDWKIISREEYALKKVYVSDAYQIINAYEANGQLVVINHYPETEGFIEAYDEQFKEIKEVIKGKSWKEISVLNPIKNSYLIEEENKKVYFSVFETYNNEEKVTVQLFYQDSEDTLGFSTFVDIDKKSNILETVKKDKTVSFLLGLIK